MSGLEVCRWFKQNERLRGIPIIFISGSDDKVEGFRAGGADFVSKPFQEEEVLARIKTHLRLRRLHVELASHNLQLEQRVAEQVKTVTASHLSTIIRARPSWPRFAMTIPASTSSGCKTFSRMLGERMREIGFARGAVDQHLHREPVPDACLHDIGRSARPTPSC